MTLAIALVTGVAILAIGWRFVWRSEARPGSPHRLHNPQRLYRDILRELPLKMSQRELLRKVARDLRLPTPTRLLLSPSQFSAAAGEWLAAGKASQRRRNELKAIAAVLFPENGAALELPDGFTAPKDSS